MVGYNQLQNGPKKWRRSFHSTHGGSESDDGSSDVRILEDDDHISVQLRNVKNEQGVFIKCKFEEKEVYLLKHIGGRILSVGDTNIPTLSEEGDSISFEKSSDEIFSSKESIETVSVTVKSDNGREDEIASHTVN